MKALLPFTCALLLAGLPLQGAYEDDLAGARKVAYDVAGAFSNDGFKLRDGFWSGKLEPKKPQLLQVNLYAGNQYWFSLGLSAGGKKAAVTLFDESGKPLAVEPYDEEGRAAAGFAPTVSGSYFVKVEEIDGSPAVFCLLYSYK